MLTLHGSNVSALYEVFELGDFLLEVIQRNLLVLNDDGNLRET